ncbi:MAG: hypothetical protein JWR61_5808, partial [Ferruginibacter sp.]|nr:hypothetical protein [Ferruginibacter sp.]
FPGSVPKEKDQANWLWLATHQGRYDYRGAHKFGKVINIEEFCEGMPGIAKVGNRGW